MKSQSLYYGKSKKNIINLPAAELAQRVVKARGNGLLQREYLAITLMILLIDCVGV